MRTIDDIIKEEINEAVDNIIFQILGRSAERIQNFIPYIEKCRNQASEQAIAAFLGELQYFGEQLVLKLRQCAKDRNLNEANNNGMASVPTGNPYQDFANGFWRGFDKPWNLFDTNPNNDYDNGNDNGNGNGYTYTAKNTTLYKLIYQTYPALFKKYQSLDNQYNGALSQMNYPRRLFDEVNYVKSCIDQSR